MTSQGIFRPTPSNGLSFRSRKNDRVMLDTFAEALSEDGNVRLAADKVGISYSYGRGPSVLHQGRFWLAGHLMPSPIPQHVCDRAELLSRAHDQKTVAEIVGINRNTVRKIARRGWKAAPTTRPFRPVPPDFAIQVRHMGYDELTRHYSTSTATIKRWRAQMGLPRIRAVRRVKDVPIRRDALPSFPRAGAL